jgi:hypothetical protein
MKEASIVNITSCTVVYVNLLTRAHTPRHRRATCFSTPATPAVGCEVFKLPRTPAYFLCIIIITKEIYRALHE